MEEIGNALAGLGALLTGVAALIAALKKKPDEGKKKN